jgi:hypothetical protein
MSDDAILNILHRVYVKGVENGSPNYNKKVIEEAAQQIRSYVLDVIGEDEGIKTYSDKGFKDTQGQEYKLQIADLTEEERIRNELRTQQRQKLS